MPNLILDLRYLSYAIAAAEHRSFRKAAGDLGVTQSTISRRIKILEDRLGFVVFRRHRFGVELTQQGQEFLASAHVDATRLQRTAQEIRLGSKTAPGEVRLGVADPFAGTVLRRILLAFSEKHPSMSVEVEEAGPATLLRRIDDGTLDIAIAAGRLPSARATSMPLWEEQPVVALSRRHKLTKLPHLSWGDLMDETFILGSCNTYRDAEQALICHFSALGRSPTIKVHRASHTVLLDLASMNIGVALTAESLVPAELRRELVLRPLPSTNQPIVPVAVWNPANRSKALKHMLEALRHGVNP